MSSPCVPSPLKTAGQPVGRVAELEAKLTMVEAELKKLKAQMQSPELTEKHSSCDNVANSADVAASPVVAVDVLEAIIVSSEMKTAEKFYDCVCFTDDDGQATMVVVAAEMQAKLKELETLGAENAGLKEEAKAAQAKEKELQEKMSRLERELAASGARERRLGEQVRAAVGAKEALESGMRRIRVQTEQWRKAAEAAAAMLAAAAEERAVEGDMRKGGGRRCSSMGGDVKIKCDGEWGSPVEGENGGEGRRRVYGVGVIGELWKMKKAQMK